MNLLYRQGSQLTDAHVDIEHHYSHDLLFQNKKNAL